MESRDAPALSSGVTVLSVPIQNCDRRALSQAWYSALHSRRAIAAPPAAVHRRITERAAPIQRGRLLQFSAAGTRRLVNVRPFTSKRLATLAPTFQQPARRASLAVQMERAFFLRQEAPRQTTFTLDDGKSRVHVTLRRIGQTVHLVALCSASAREAVAQALVEIQCRLHTQGLKLRAVRNQEVVR
jgi:hypothetical protein